MPTVKNVIKVIYRGATRHKEMTSKRGNKNFHPSRGIQPTGMQVGVRFRNVKEMIPEIIVPNLEGFKLKPYVSHKCPDTVELRTTARDLFEACIAPQVKADFKAGKYANAAAGSNATKAAGQTSKS